MSTPQEILRDLCALRRSGYGNELPGKADAQYIEFAEQYAESAATERAAIRNSVSDECRLLLLGFSDRLAILADRTSDSRLLLLALVAHAVEDFRYDERENIFRLALVNHVAEKLGESPTVLFGEAEQLSSPRGATALRQFMARPAELKSLRAMRIVEEQTETGVSYRYE